MTVWAPERRLLTAGLVGLITAAAFEGMAVPTVLPVIVDELGGLSLYGWAFSAFFLTSILGISLGGADADRHGPARAFAAGCLLFTAGMAVAGLADSMAVIIAGRAIQGLGSGALTAVTYVAIARAYHPTARPRMIALISSAWVVPGLVGPALAGVVAEQASWRWVFLALCPAVLLIGAACLQPMAAIGRSAHADLSGSRVRGTIDALRLTAGSSLLLAALGVGRPALAAALLVAGIALGYGALRRLLPPGALVARPGPPAVVALIFLAAFAFLGTEAFVPLAVTTVRGESVVIGGLALSAAAVTWALGSWLAARLGADGRRRPLVRTGGLLIGAGIAVTAAVLHPAAPVPVAALGWAIAGLGMGLAYSTLSLLVLETAAPGREGAASAAGQLMFTLGTALGAGIGGALVALSEATRLPLPAGIALADGVMFTAAAMLVVLVRRTPRRSEHPAEVSLAVGHEPPLAAPAERAQERSRS